jgi:hypothetical protein
MSGMLVFELTAKKKISMNGLLNPDAYTGSGDLLVLRGVKSKVLDPKNWKKDFPEYSYQYPELRKIKDALNKTKHTMDEFRRTPKDDQYFSRFTDTVRPHDPLRGRNGILAAEFGAEIVTNAYLKMYETMMFIDPGLEKLAKKREEDDRIFRTLHIAEAPGNFMLAINHYLKTNYPILKWEWMASSWRNINNPVRGADPSTINTHYLEDQYGLIAQHKDRWIFGADGDGDITSPANLRAFKQEVDKRYGGTLNFMTSDVKYVPMNVNFDEEENINKPVHMGHLLCALMSLSAGGNMMLKEFTIFESSSVALLYLAASCFDQLLIIKPETSRPANSEIYILGLGYHPLSPIDIERLLEIMNYIRPLNNEHGSPAILRKKDIPEEFIEQIIKISDKLAKSQIEQLEKNVSLYKKYKLTPLNKVREDFYKTGEKASREWIDKMKFKPLREEDKIAKEQTQNHNQGHQNHGHHNQGRHNQGRH